MKRTFKLLAVILLFAVSACNSADLNSAGTGDKPTASVQKKVKVGIFGDSISSFDGFVPQDYTFFYPRGNVERINQIWWHKLIYQLMPYARLDRNNSYSGTLVTHLNPKPDYDQNINHFASPSRCLQFDDPDIILIFGGTNDRRSRESHTVPLGNYDFDKSIEELDVDQFRPAYIRMIRQLQKNYPGVKIVCMVGPLLYNPEKGHVFLSQSIKEIAGHFNLPVVELLPTLGITTIGDGVHPNVTDMDIIAREVYKVLEENNLLTYRRDEAGESTSADAA